MKQTCHLLKWMVPTVLLCVWTFWSFKDPYRKAGPTEPQLLEQSLVRRLTPAEFLSLSEAGRDYVRQYGREL